MSMTDEGVARDRLRLLPPIRRARLWRLYAEDRAAGRPWRFLDLWMDDGRSLLGAKGSGLGAMAKAAIDVGLTRPFPSVREARLERELLRRYPEYASLRLFRDEGRALAAAAAFLAPGELLPVLRPFSEFLPEPPSGAARPRLAMPRLPCPAALAPAVLLFREAAEAESLRGDLIAPLALACAHRALAELDRFRFDYAEALWKKTDRRLSPFFERRGPYLYPRADEAGYEAFFRAALSAGVLLSPCLELPSIIPGDFDDGELSKLGAALAVIPGMLAD
jgi:hypothetical protein